MFTILLEEKYSSARIALFGLLSPNLNVERDNLIEIIQETLLFNELLYIICKCANHRDICLKRLALTAFILYNINVGQK